MMEGIGRPSLQDEEKALEESARQAILESPIVAATLAAFPDARLM